MTKSPDFDVQAAHQSFSKDCFNRAWDLIEKQDRSEEDNLQMILLGMASLWHWTEREDRKATNLSVGYWQVSRINALLDEPEQAMKFGRLCLEVSKEEDVPQFYLAYAHEALARAAAVAGNQQEMEEHLRQAKELAESLEDPDLSGPLLADLDTIG